MTCPSCGKRLFSPTDQKYAELYGKCWEENKDDWLDGKLSLAEFEEREEKALEASLV